MLCCVYMARKENVFFPPYPIANTFPSSELTTTELSHSTQRHFLQCSKAHVPALCCPSSPHITLEILLCQHRELLNPYLWLHSIPLSSGSTVYLTSPLSPTAWFIFNLLSVVCPSMSTYEDMSKGGSPSRELHLNTVIGS